jgi:serine/threonine-protein kinase
VALRRQALALRRQLSGPDHPKTLDALYELGSTLHRAGDHRAAGPLFDEWMAAIARQPRAITPVRAEQLASAARLLELGGERDRAEAMFRETLAIRRALYGERHHLVAASLTSLGNFLDIARRREEAEPLLREAVAMLRATYPDGHPQLASTLKSWGIVLEHLKRFPEAQAPLREALAMRRRFAGEHSVDVAMTELDLSYALTMSGAYDEAASLARDAVRLLRAELGGNSSMVAFAQIALGDALRGQGQYAAAESLLLAGYQRFEIPKPITRQWRGYALAALVRLYDAEGRPDEAARYRALLESPPK